MDAPEGTEAVKVPSEVVISTSTVGLPRESMISRPLTPVMADMDLLETIWGALRRAAAAVEEIIVAEKVVGFGLFVQENNDN